MLRRFGYLNPPNRGMRTRLSGVAGVERRLYPLYLFSTEHDVMAQPSSRDARTISLRDGWCLHELQRPYQIALQIASVHHRIEESFFKQKL